MVISTVTVSSLEEMRREKVKINRSTPIYIRKFKKMNNVNVFSFSRPFSRSNSVPDLSNSNNINNNEFRVILLFKYLFIYIYLFIYLFIYYHNI